MILKSRQEEPSAQGKEASSADYLIYLMLVDVNSHNKKWMNIYFHVTLENIILLFHDFLRFFEASMNEKDPKNLKNT